MIFGKPDELDVHEFLDELGRLAHPDYQSLVRAIARFYGDHGRTTEGQAAVLKREAARHGLPWPEGLRIANAPPRRKATAWSNY
jgi:hypothetical protein